MAEVLSIISIISFVLAGIFFVVSILLWFNFKIPKVMGDLSGRTAKKSIEKIRERNVQTGNKSFNPSAINSNRGKLTEQIKNIVDSEGIVLQTQGALKLAGTEVLEENKANAVQGDSSTSLLGEESSTEVLETNGTTILKTTVEPQTLNSKEKAIVNFEILDEVILIHTNEII